MTTNTEEALEQLNRLVRAKTGDARARAHSLETLPGHAGFSYSFVLERDARRLTSRFRDRLISSARPGLWFQ